VEVGTNAVIVAVTGDEPRILTVGEGGPVGLPFGTLDPEEDRTLERALRRWVREHTGIELGYVEQLYTLGDVGRGPDPSVRLVSVTYLALVREADAGPAVWRDWYDFLPWEDWRSGRPTILGDDIERALNVWAEAGGDDREAGLERIQIMFGTEGSAWDAERTLQRYELLWEAGFLPEAGRERTDDAIHGRPMRLDHRRIAAQALGRLRGKLRYRPVVFELVPETFTLTGLQRVVEALWGARLHTQNFRRLLDRGGLVEGTGITDPSTGGRPAELFRFRREVVRERPAPGVGLPGLPTSG
jgi:hypothetical protein